MYSFICLYNFNGSIVKVKFVLYSYEFKDVEHEDYCLANPICCDWKHPFLPRRGEQINIKNLFPEELKRLNLPDDFYIIKDIEWNKDHVEIWCEGEN
jgi:hypothetical protein